ncbi:MAG TPA: SCO family protein [Burkholderiaceae bacterium]
MKHKAAFLLAGIVLAGLAGAAVLSRSAPQPQENALMYDTLPFYIKADLMPRWRGADGRHIEDLALIDQDGKRFDEAVFRQGPTVVNFFYSGCATVCPVSMELLDLTRKDLGSEAPNFLSISVTPLQDNPAALRAYAKKIGLPRQWHLATGVPKQVYAMAREQLLTDIETPGLDGQPPHTERAMLIDTEGRIRGIYDANQAIDLMRMRYDLRRLRREERADRD